MVGCGSGVWGSGSLRGHRVSPLGSRARSSGNAGGMEVSLPDLVSQGRMALGTIWSTVVTRAASPTLAGSVAQPVGEDRVLKVRVARGHPH